ncbi:hypothetical protein [Streptomyces sp. NPDC048142]|uniref:hypothetical protein n=1 Tax=Streptomyces sp. NPDC048142 TaxID=3365501 RepID=UPI003716071A
MTFLKVGGLEYERWMLSWSAMTGSPLDKIKESGLTVERKDPTRHDHWDNLIRLVEADDSPKA